MGFVDRFQPNRPTGSSPYHYVLGEAGAFVVATRLGRDFKHFDWHRTDVDQAPFNRFLTHLVEQNSFFTRLASAYRRSGQGHLAKWRNGYDPTFRWSVVPDGFGTVVEGNRTVQFAYEHDRGTESGGQLKDKIDRYQKVAAALEDDRNDDSPVILFCIQSERREKSARGHLFGSGFPVATGVYQRVMDEPLGRVWLPLIDEVHVRLIDLGYLRPLWRATEIR